MRGAPASVTLEALPDERVGELCRRVLAADGAQAAAAAFGRCRMVHAGRRSRAARRSRPRASATARCCTCAHGRRRRAAGRCAGRRAAVRARRDGGRALRRRRKARDAGRGRRRLRRRLPTTTTMTSRSAVSATRASRPSRGSDGSSRRACRGSVACVHVECLNLWRRAAPTRARRARPAVRLRVSRRAHARRRLFAFRGGAAAVAASPSSSRSTRPPRSARAARRPSRCSRVWARRRRRALGVRDAASRVYAPALAAAVAPPRARARGARPRSGRRRGGARGVGRLALAGALLVAAGVSRSSR